MLVSCIRAIRKYVDRKKQERKILKSMLDINKRSTEEFKNPITGNNIRIVGVIDQKTISQPMEKIMKENGLTEDMVEDGNEYYTIFNNGILIRHKLSKTKPVYKMSE